MNFERKQLIRDIDVLSVEFYDIVPSLKIKEAILDQDEANGAMLVESFMRD